MYTIVKHLHISIIVLCYVIFLIHFVLMMKNSEKAKSKLLKISPHILYTLFVITFVYLVWINPLELIPFAHSWATTKLAGFVFFVLSISFSLKWAKSTAWKVVGLISATFWLFMTARLGFADHLKVKSSDEDVNAAIYFVTDLSSRLFA